MPFSRRSLRLLVLCPAAVLLTACSPQTQTSPLTASAIEPARTDAPVTTPLIETAPVGEVSSPAPAYASSAAQRRFEKKQRGCQADPVPDECIN